MYIFCRSGRTIVTIRRDAAGFPDRPGISISERALPSSIYVRIVMAWPSDSTTMSALYCRATGAAQAVPPHQSAHHTATHLVIAGPPLSVGSMRLRSEEHTSELQS